MVKLLTKDYQRLLKEIKSKIFSARIRAVHQVNKELIKLYWEIGEALVKKQKEYGWGKSVVENLAKDLQLTFPDVAGFSSRNLWDMKRLYEAYQGQPILRQAVAEIPWGHNLLILNKIFDMEERRYYLEATAALGWSRNVLLNQIKADAYKNQKYLPKQHNFPKVLPVHLMEQADESIKSVYNLDFLGIKEPVLEKELEKRLVGKIKQFILELGYGFSFIGSQYKLVLDKNEYFVDLLFFNRKLKSLVAIELKTGEFKPEYAGKMDFYLQLLNEQTKLEDENPAIGIILCAEKDHIVVEYALRNLKHPVGVAQYHLINKLPKQYQGLLPGASDFKRQIETELGGKCQ